MLTMKQKAALKPSGALAGFERVASGLLRLAATGLVFVALAGPIGCGDSAGAPSVPTDPGGTRGPTDPGGTHDPASPSTGSLEVATSTDGQHFDRDGYLLTIDDVDSLHLDPTGTAKVELAPGQHRLGFFGVADNCWFLEPQPEIDISAGNTISVSWAVSCRAPTMSGVLAFESGGNIYLSDLQGSTLRRLTPDALLGSYNTGATWSPDGRRIAFSRYQDQLAGPLEAAIYVFDLKEGTATRLSPAGTYDATPTWSPDGKRIAFENRDREGDDHIVLMNADGTKRVQLTTNRQFLLSPAWSPDGRRIAYVASSSSGHGSHIAVMSPDGTHDERLTNGVDIDTEPTWSTDGKRIAFSRSGNLVIMNADGTSPVVLTSTRDAYHPAWSPDGSTIAMTRFTDCKPDPLDPYGEPICPIGIWVAQVADGQMHELPLGPWYWNPRGPSWRP
jgi:dipeptidyl aminopeptidase/acylaminoacyl peptidase